MADRKRRIAEARRSQPIAELERKAAKATIRHRCYKGTPSSPERMDLEWAMAYRGTEYLGQQIYP